MSTEASSALSKRRKELRNELSLIEKQIYDLETTYLEDSKEFGNVFIGWSGYLATDKTKVKKSVQNEERLFSLSSVSSPASRRHEVQHAKVEPKPASNPVGKEGENSEAKSAVKPASSKKRKDIEDFFLETLDDLQVEF